MLLVAARGREDEVRRIFAKWELDAVEIGRVTAGGTLTARLSGEVVAHVPLSLLAEAPKYTKPTAPPGWLTEPLALDPPTRPEPPDYGEACRALEIPVVGGNVSFYNETNGQAILPTPVIGVVGILEDAGRRATQWFKGAGHRVALLGPDHTSLGGSEYLWRAHRRLGGRLAPLELELERKVQAAVRAAVSAGLVTAAHDCSEGGLAVALAEGCVTGRELVGLEAALDASGRGDQVLFGEGPSRVMVSVEPARVREFEALMAESAIPWRWIGTTGGDRLVLRLGTKRIVDVALDRIERAWRSGFERHMA